ncbi:hypothetical protein [Pseudonocardia acaciae]|uniref:hypothetical protein n=1 Tax=Pseudonocardia acaciae TaxID=551276 RepID=UPI00056235FD|nr:hypothetical protein [Pseudonocardia acaciae]
MTITMTDRLDLADKPTAREPGQDAAALSTMTQLISMTLLMDKLSDQARQQVAARPTVTAHLGHAREHLVLARRSLDHARGTLAYNTAHQSAARPPAS